MLYAREETWDNPGGKGPAAGLLVFPLTTKVARQVEREGMRYFDAMPPKAAKYAHWRQTPMRLPGPDADPGHRSLGTGADPAIARRVEAVVGAPGSFYATSRAGVLVVSPRERLLIYLYYT